jgi:catechol 2,3-dioxygenase
VHLKVADLDRSLAFWRDVLGFDEMARVGDQAAFISAGGYHHHIGLNTWDSKGAPLRRPPERGLVPRRRALSGPRDLADAVRRVLQGDPARGRSDHGVSEAIYLRDPDDNGVELYRDRPREEWPKDEAGNFDVHGAARPAGALRQPVGDLLETSWARVVCLPRVLRALPTQ